MTPVLQAFPRRPLTVQAPRGAWRSWVWFGVCVLLFLGSAWWLGKQVWPDLASDFAVREQAVPLANARVVDGRCRSRLALVQDCEATLVVPLKSGEVRRRVDHLFVDPHFGSYTIRVMADPARPELATTDLALDHLWNRVATLAGFAAIGLLILAGGWLTLSQGRRDGRLVKALSGQVLTPVPLVLRSIVQGTWHLADQAGAPLQFTVPRKARPFALEPTGRLVLGVTAPGAPQPMPLDAGLRWVSLTEAERAALLQARGGGATPR